MADDQRRSVRVPPRWFVRFFWSAHRTVYRLSRGRLGLRRARPDRWGMAGLTTTGRRTGQPRSVIIGYLADGPNLFALAMNGWADGEPSWWLNLQAEPEARVDLGAETRPVRARPAESTERSRLWAQWQQLDGQLDAYADLRSSRTAVVIFEPHPEE